jgi:hypothetical protein
MSHSHNDMTLNLRPWIEPNPFHNDELDALNQRFSEPCSTMTRKWRKRIKPITFKTPIFSVMWYTNLKQEVSLGRELLELLVSTADPIEEWWTWSEKDYVLTSSNLTTFPTRIQATDTCQKRTEVDETPIELCKSSTGHRSDTRVQSASVFIKIFFDKTTTSQDSRPSQTTLSF